MKVLLLGDQGQVGQAFVELSKSDAFPIGWELIAWNREAGDLSTPLELIHRVKTAKPDLIINAAAFTQVDLAEHEKALCDAINANAPRLLAQYSALAGIPFVHFSTDYVYSGEGTEAHLETEISKPKNHYGLSKARGDDAIVKSGCDHLIFRTSWVFSYTGKNFVRTMLKLGATKKELNVVNDQYGSPSYAPDLASMALDAVMQGLEKKTDGAKFPSGIYHLTNSGVVNWAEFAQAILPKVQITGIPTTEYPTPAIRPLNSRLSLEKFSQTFGISPRPWQNALADCIAHLEKAP